MRMSGFPLKEEGLCGSLCSNPLSFGSILFVLLSTNSKLRFQLSDQLRNQPMSTNSVPTSFDKSQSRSNPPQSMVACLPTLHSTANCLDQRKTRFDGIRAGQRLT